MNKKVLFTLWGVLFIVCAGLGFIPEPVPVLRGIMTALSVAFFVPPAVLLYRGGRETAQLIRNLSAASLGLTLVLLVLNLVFAVSSEFLGSVLHYVLTIVSAPMICSGYWALSLFLWACLLMASRKKCRTA
ncbi:MAG: hypothetical protein IJE81_06560 [Oscillospiraceae bacterium]|nr:hypothetical protein [Oscillospiraceae bacterium]